MSEHLNEKFIAAMKYMNETLKKDIAAGHIWKYCNTSSKKVVGFENKRKQGKYLANCVDGVQDGLRMIGLSGIFAWFGGNGNIVWLNGEVKDKVKKYFDIINTGGKTVRQLYDSGQLCDGDILLGYQGYSHTNAYLGGGKSFDTGHAYCSKQGEMAPFTKWIGNLAHSSSKVNYILRLKDRAHYRVQCGAFKDINTFKETVAKLNAAGYKTMQVVEDGYYKIQVGYFSGKTNADNYAAKLVKKGFPAFVTEATSTPATEVTAATIQESDQVKPETSTATQPTPAQTTNKKIVYRVQVGAFSQAQNRDEVGANVKKKTGLDTFWEKKDGIFHLFCGSFEQVGKAEERASLLRKKKIPCIIKEWDV